MKCLLLLLAASGLFANDVTVTYRVINLTTTPECQADASFAPTIGVLSFVSTNNGAIAKFEITLDYVDLSGKIHEVQKTVSRKMGRGGFDPGPVMALFSLPLQEVISVRAEGFSDSLEGATANTHQPFHK